MVHPNDFELNDEDWKEINYENKAANATKRAREEGYISAEEAKEQSPYGWYNCEHCDWDGPYAPMRNFDDFTVYCPECEEDLST